MDVYAQCVMKSLIHIKQIVLNMIIGLQIIARTAAAITERLLLMSEQRWDKIIELLEQYGIPLAKFYVVVYVVISVIAIGVFVAVLVSIFREWKHWDKF